MSNPPSFESIVDRFEAMHPQTNQTLAAQTPETAKVMASTSQHLLDQQRPAFNMQSIEDFEREQDAIEAQLAAEARPRQDPRQVIEPLKKKSKKVTDADELDAEEKALVEMENGNWIGRLQIYRDARPVPGGGTGIAWTESTEANPIPRFACTLVIHETMNRFGYETIGSTSKVVSFSNKKSAKQYAAKKAIDWLIANEYMPKDNGIHHKAIPAPQPKKPKIPPPPPKVKVTPSTPLSALNKWKTQSTSSPSTPQPPSEQGSFAQRIPELCHRLGVNIPTYRITQDTPGSPLCDAYADFGGDSVVDGKVGEVWNVYGKKNAKEQVAGHTYLFLKDIERRRMAQLDLVDIDASDDDEDRKRKREVGGEGGSPEIKSKSMKVDA